MKICLKPKIHVWAELNSLSKGLKRTSLLLLATSSSKMKQFVVYSVPSIIKRKAQLVISLLKDNSNVSWEDDDTVKLYGKSISGSQTLSYQTLEVCFKR